MKLVKQEEKKLKKQKALAKNARAKSTQTTQIRIAQKLRDTNEQSITTAEETEND